MGGSDARPYRLCLSPRVTGLLIISFIQKTMSVFTKSTLLFLLATTAVWAQETQLEPVTVTANRTDQKLSQTGKVVTVLPDSVLQKYATQSVGELLSRQAGFMVVGTQGPLGTNQDVYARGAGQGNTLILLDGVPIYDPSGINNTFDLNLLSVGEIERIEILKGAQSTLYGSDAVAGVINIFTRKEGDRPLGASATVQAGSYGTFRSTVGLNSSSKAGYFNAQYTRLRSDGFSAAHDAKGNQNFDKDGFWQDNALFNGGIQLGSKLLWKVRGMYSWYRNELDAGAFTDSTNYDYTNTMKMAGTGFEYTHKLGKLTANYAFTTFDRKSELDQSSFEGNTHFAELYHSWNIRPWFDLITGADLRSQNTYQANPYGPPIQKDTAHTQLISAYITALLRSRTNLALELGGRYNHHSLYGSNVTYSVNPSYLFKDRYKAFVNLSSGFRTPTLYQLYSPYGNKSLKPETSRSLELGVQWFSKDKKSNVRVLYFDRLIKQVIDFQSLNQPPYGRYVNYNQQKDHGFELEGSYLSNGWSLTANATYVTGQVTQPLNGRDTTFNNLFRRPKMLVNATLGYQITPKVFASATVRSLGKRSDRFYNGETFQTELVELKPYTTLDVYAEYQINTFLRVYGDVRNLLNEQYFDSYGYNTRGRNFTAGVRFQF
ncbi:TonB-dependent receptor plug domain-containing protein [Siphonobacter curvatus]|uniref:TonB-dependent receptor plug domain-containing protein n=1 Tax=Siphonobacter curvatus TaxID=2094562 RepID=UPI0013FD916C|nr:TonB-dependent receptor [Siphonobacter curvatus]